MVKDAFYFSHDSNAARDPKIIQMRSVYKSEGYGWYWMLVEQMREQDNYKLPLSGKYAINAYALQMDADALRLQGFINDCVSEFRLFMRDDNFLWSESLLRRMVIKEEKSEKARKAANKRWNKRIQNDADAFKKDATALQPECEGNAIKERKKKVRKINTTPTPSKGNELFDTFWKEYPKRVNKGAAEKAFNKIKPSKELVDTMIKSIQQHKMSEGWLKDGGQFIPYPGTWLNAKGWEDELTTGIQVPRSPTLADYKKEENLDNQ